MAPLNGIRPGSKHANDAGREFPPRKLTPGWTGNGSADLEFVGDLRRPQAPALGFTPAQAHAKGLDLMNSISARALRHPTGTGLGMRRATVCNSKSAFLCAFTGFGPVLQTARICLIYMDLARVYAVVAQGQLRFRKAWVSGSSPETGSSLRPQKGAAPFSEGAATPTSRRKGRQ